MSDIFISYEKSDLPHAERLARSLRGRGWTTFWDRTIPIGSTWRKTIETELDGARCVVVLWSKASMVSRWVHEEADDALGRGILVPVLIEDIRAPIGFRSIQAAHLVNWDGTDTTPAFSKLVADIAALIGPSPKEVGGEVGLAEAEVEDKAEKEPKRDYRETKNEKSEAYADAMYSLGSDCELGLGVEQDYVKARECYEEAAAKGHAGAMNSLGLLYLRGGGVAKNYFAAREWFEKAAAMGHAEAMCALGLLDDNGSMDPDKAREWYEKAAAKGHAGAMYYLGRLYHNGAYNVAMDYAKAREWFEKAAAKGHAGAMNSLGDHYLYGLLGELDYIKAREWYEKAAAKGNAQSMYALGRLYHDGGYINVEQDYVKAREWYEKAVAAKGHAAARDSVEAASHAAARANAEADLKTLPIR